MTVRWSIMASVLAFSAGSAAQAARFPPRSQSGGVVPEMHEGVALRLATPVPVCWKGSHPLVRGVELWTSGLRAKAFDKFKEAVELCPKDPIAWHDLGVAFYAFGQYEKSLKAHEHERFLSPTAPSAWYGIGHCLLALNRLPEAENAFVMGVVEAPREWEYWAALSEALRRQGKMEAARVAGRNAGHLRPRKPAYPWRYVVIENAVKYLRFPRIATFR